MSLENTWEFKAFVKSAKLGAICFLPVGDGKFLMQADGPLGKLKARVRPPGGGYETKDKKLYETCVRELGEEFGLDRDTVIHKLKFLGFEKRPSYWGNAVFELRDHGLRPGTYQASNDPDETVTLVETDLDDPKYTGPEPKELIKRASDAIRDHADKIETACQPLLTKYQGGVRIKGSCGHMVKNVKCTSDLPIEKIDMPCYECSSHAKEAAHKLPWEGKPADDTYGRCPTCNAFVVQRTRGGKNAKDTCENGHVYSSFDTIKTEKSAAMNVSDGKVADQELPMDDDVPVKREGDHVSRLRKLKRAFAGRLRDASLQTKSAGDILSHPQVSSSIPEDTFDDLTIVCPTDYMEKAAEENPWLTSTGATESGENPIRSEPALPKAPKGVPLTGPEAIGHALSKLDLDAVEADSRDVVRRKLKSKRPLAVKRLGYIQGFRRSEIKPGDLMISRVPVIPPQFRPYSVAGETFIPGDANELYRDLINMTQVHDELKQHLGAEGVKGNKLRIYDAVRAVYGFGEPVSPKTKERGVAGFMQKITGTNPKHSIVQRNLLSRDMDFVGRGVIGLDPDLGLDEIGIPESAAWKPYGPYIQRRLIRGGMSREAAVKAIQDQSSEARAALEAEMKERPVMYSRAPAWHKFNAIGGWPKLVKGNTIMINPLVTTGMTADFDGDTMTFHVPSLPDAVNDVKHKLMPSKMLFSIKDPTKAQPTPKQEQILGVFSAQQRKAKAHHVFPDEQSALKAIRAGTVRYSDEVTIGQPNQTLPRPVTQP